MGQWRLLFRPLTGTAEETGPKVFAVISPMEHQQDAKFRDNSACEERGARRGKRTEIRTVDGQSLQFAGSEHKANKGQLL